MIENCALEEKNIEHDQSLLAMAISQYKTRLADYKGVAKAIVSKLDYLQGFTEETFIRIGDKLPDINQGLRNVENEAKNLSDYFRKESGLLNDGNSKSGDLNRLNHASKYLIEVAEEQSKAFLKMSDMMKRIENIKSSIESIRDFAAEMEMLSLNASIVAIKAGDSGRTLNPITVELKKMANSAILLIDEIVNTSEQLADKYDLFRELSERQAESCKADVERISVKLTERYLYLQNSISDLVGGLEQIIMITSESKQPISKIMNILQIQDILKQCTDHVRFSLEESSSEADSLVNNVQAGGPNPEQVFDAISFQEKVPLLCIQLLDDIDIRLEESIRELKDGFETLNSLLNGITSCQRSGITGTLNESAIASIEESFKGLEGVVVQTASMTQNVANSWDKLWSTALGLENMLETLEKQFRQLKKLTNFHLINIPIKIEVARSTGLSKDGELSERVEGLADYISTEMRQSHKDVARDYQFLEQMVESMSRHKNDIENNLESIAFDIDDLLGSFFKAKEQVKSTYGKVCDSVSELHQLIHTSIADLERINELVEQNKELKGDFGILSEMIADVKESVVSAAGTVDWELHDGRLSEIVNKFTVLAHKKIAGDICNIEIEEGGKEGELVLF
ncbi:MAG: methyl-accepting chemotaxis protein [Firmicutes bacterium]|nr:methyl-accepting chemotaxis protein [Bacillota bacterium]